MLPRMFHDRAEGENRCVMYVALTRARDFLAVTHSEPSSFVDEIRCLGAELLRSG